MAITVENKWAQYGMESLPLLCEYWGPASESDLDGATCNTRLAR